MRFICILLLLFCCHSYAADGEIFQDGRSHEYHLTISTQNQPEVDQPIMLRHSMTITRYSIVKKIAVDSMLSGRIFVLSCIKNMPVPVMAVAGIHVKNYLRHIYPSMHFW